MKRPSFQFYPADWKSNTKLRRCSEAARGAWMDVLCTLHDGDEYGLVRWPLAELAQVSGAQLKYLRELAGKEVLKGADRGPVEFVYRPRHGGKDGDPVVLIKTEGPCWFSSRMVVDEYVRSRRGASTRFGADNQSETLETETRQPNATPKPPIGGGKGDGPTSPSPSTSPSAEEGFSLRSESDIDPKKSSKTSKKQAIPEGCPGPGDQHWAMEHWKKKGRLDLCRVIEDEIGQFRDHHSKLRSVMADWSAAWRTWVRNAVKFNKQVSHGTEKSPNGNGSHGSSISDAVRSRRHGGLLAGRGEPDLGPADIDIEARDRGEVH